MSALYTFYIAMHTQSPGPSGEFSIKVTYLKRHKINTLNASRTWVGGEAGKSQKDYKPSSTRSVDFFLSVALHA